MHHAWGPDVLDHYKAFERGMRRRSKKGQARWMKYDPAVDKVDYATWYLNRWIEFLDKTPAIYLFEPRSAKCFEKMPEAKPEANAEPMPEGGLFNIF
jgi:hypothetical protein